MLCWRFFLLFVWIGSAAAWLSTDLESLTRLNQQPYKCNRFFSTSLYMGLRGKKIRRAKRQALRDETPARIQTPYGPIRFNKPPRICDCCQGRGRILCSVCRGIGAVRATGNRKRNQVFLPKLVGSRWTSVEIRYGHRHHQVLETRGSNNKQQDNGMQVRMLNCCGDQRSFWINLDELKDKTMWRPGWQTLEQIQQADGGPLIDARVCFRCKGDRILPCVECFGKGEIPSYEPLYN